MGASKSFKPYRAADYLQSPEEAAEYLNVAMEDGHPAVLLKALCTVADAAENQRYVLNERVVVATVGTNMIAKSEALLIHGASKLPLTLYSATCWLLIAAALK